MIFKKKNDIQKKVIRDGDDRFNGFKLVKTEIQATLNKLLCVWFRESPKRKEKEKKND